jgi:hypothetical protein
VCLLHLSRSTGLNYLKPMGIMFAIAVWGTWYLINGIIMLVVPKIQSGDVAEQ